MPTTVTGALVMVPFTPAAVCTALVADCVMEMSPLPQAVIAPPAVSVAPFASTIELLIVTPPVGASVVAVPTVMVPVVAPAALDVELITTEVPFFTDEATAP
jgi:hypothetical protein